MTAPGSGPGRRPGSRPQVRPARRWCVTSWVVLSLKGNLDGQRCAASPGGRAGDRGLIQNGPILGTGRRALQAFFTNVNDLGQLPASRRRVRIVPRITPQISPAADSMQPRKVVMFSQ